MQKHDTVMPEQVIEVPKLSHDSIPQRSAVRHPQTAEQDPVYVAMVLASKVSGQSSTASELGSSEQIGDVPVPQVRRGGGGGLQGSRAGQNSTAADAEQSSLTFQFFQVVSSRVFSRTGFKSFFLMFTRCGSGF